MRFDGFDWDEGDRGKCEKHGLLVAEVEALFRGTPALHPDRAHSAEERRFLLIATTADGRSALVAFTWRRKGGRNLVRPISARYMHAKEVRHYDRQQGARTDSGLSDG